MSMDFKQIDELLEVLALEKRKHISPLYVCQRLNSNDIEGITNYLLSLNEKKIKISYQIGYNKDSRYIIFDFTSRFVEDVIAKWDNKDSIYILNGIDNGIIESVVDGVGLRLVIFLAGCPHRCPNCHNPQSWDIRNGKEVPITELASYIVQFYQEGHYQGITFSGGDPLMQHKPLERLIKEIRNQIPSINIWCYTGFIYEQIKDMDVLKEIDVLVDGPYIEKQRFPLKKFRGSNNQRILFLKNGVVINEE